MKDFIILFVVSLLAMLIAMMLIRFVSRLTGNDHSFGELGREMLVMLGITVVQMLILVMLAVFGVVGKSDGRNASIYVLVVGFSAMKGFRMSRQWVSIDWEPYMYWEPRIFALTTLACHGGFFLTLKLLSGR